MPANFSAQGKWSLYQSNNQGVGLTLFQDSNGKLTGSAETLTASKTAVVALVDEIAWKVTGPAEFRQWSDELLPEIDQFKTQAYREFIRRRIHDWLFCLSVEDGHVPTPAELAEVTDWMQRHLAEWSTSPAVLALLAGSANTRKTRNIAKNRAGSGMP